MLSRQSMTAPLLIRSLVISIFKRSQSDALQEKAFVVDVVVHVHTHLL